MAIIELRGAYRTYAMGETTVPALAPVDLRIETGELLMLFGPSGSGKSTLLNLIGGLDSPTGGEVLYQGRPLAGEDVLESHRRDHVGFIFQFYNLIPNLTALENVELASLTALDPIPPGEALERVGLTDRKDHFPSQLSGGEQQRVAIARALTKRPELLLCDEPTGALEAETGLRVLTLLHEIHKDLGATVVIVTHNASLAPMARRIIRLRSGHITEDVLHERPAHPRELTW